jgi:hypothetical protein
VLAFVKISLPHTHGPFKFIAIINKVEIWWPNLFMKKEQLAQTVALASTATQFFLVNYNFD